MMDWNALQLMLAVARAGTLSAAARRLSVDQTTVSRRLKALEADLGTALFSRIDGCLIPTQAGERAIAAAESMESSAGKLQERLSGALQSCEGSVRLTAVPILMNRLLIPNLEPLLAKHPRLQLETIAETGNLSLNRRETDLALRFARPQKDAGLCRHLADVSYALYGVAAGGRRSDALITYEETHAHLPQARWMSRQAERGGNGQLRVNDAESALAAVQAGLGLSLLPEILAASDRSLVRMTEGPAVLSREVWLLVHPEVRQLPRIQAVIDWLDKLFK
ncbi:LysR family transcriptional regulator [Denitrobaculum tricleocarpae]|uniref:LysR family transcriptional regulator n=1 Tax=Denitrobaculum tricleocarpae TaxID=2591009 RepID=A0A545TAZ7_9PROT|nr:LysR family transcriptional regulator [Denitrobaculum tricleocarpae]TQV74364.1 LysR family transcriptional regulator [Denitrobaculum tricleocarpae]